MDQVRITLLISKYFENSLTLEESLELKNLIERLPSDQEIPEVFSEIWSQSANQNPVLAEENKEKLIQNVLQKAGRTAKLPALKMRYFSAAAAIIVMVVSTVFFYFSKNTAATQSSNELANTIDSALLQPGYSKATLTLQDGTAIALDSLQEGILFKNDEVTVLKEEDGKIVFLPQGDFANNGLPIPSKVWTNTVSTPLGGDYKIIMSDGSTIWLNAGSTLQYPSVFSGNERKVQLTGEAFFEVAHNPAMPFYVEVEGTKIKVLGTKFNVNAYQNEEALKTTLIEGKVLISKGNNELVLNPGEQAVTFGNSNVIQKRTANVEEVVAWKNGFFQFERADIATIMRQVSRWYNIEVVFEGKINPIDFSGKISKNVPAQTVLRILEEGGMHFEIYPNKIIVKP